MTARRGAHILVRSKDRKTEFKEMGRFHPGELLPGCSVSRGEAPPNSPHTGRESTPGALGPSGDVRMSMHLSDGQERKEEQPGQRPSRSSGARISTAHAEQLRELWTIGPGGQGEAGRRMAAAHRMYWGPHVLGRLCAVAQ